MGMVLFNRSMSDDTRNKHEKKLKVGFQIDQLRPEPNQLKWPFFIEVSGDDDESRHNIVNLYTSVDGAI